MWRGLKVFNVLLYCIDSLCFISFLFPFVLMLFLFLSLFTATAEVQNIYLNLHFQTANRRGTWVANVLSFLERISHVTSTLKVCYLPS